MAHPELGLNILERLAGELAELATIETQPKLEGRNMHMLIAPLKKAPEKAAKPDETDTETDTEAVEPAEETE
jgi:translation initiation factor IF-3